MEATGDFNPCFNGLVETEAADCACRTELAAWVGRLVGQLELAMRFTRNLTSRLKYEEPNKSPVLHFHPSGCSRRQGQAGTHGVAPPASIGASSGASNTSKTIRPDLTWAALCRTPLTGVGAGARAGAGGICFLFRTSSLALGQQVGMERSHECLLPVRDHCRMLGTLLNISISHSDLDFDLGCFLFAIDCLGNACLLGWPRLVKILRTVKFLDLHWLSIKFVDEL